jgi:hypothetical protein
MNKKLLLLGLVVLGIMMSTSMVSAYTPYNYYSNYYGRGYAYQPARVGGFFGANSAYIIGLRPGTYYDTSCIRAGPSMYYQPCRAGGWFGNYGYNNYGSGSYGYGNYGYAGYSNYQNVPYVYHGPL